MLSRKGEPESRWRILVFSGEGGLLAITCAVQARSYDTSMNCAVVRWGYGDAGWEEAAIEALYLGSQDVRK